MQTEILESAREYLIENFGNLVSAGEIYFDKRKNTWNVKIIAKTPKETLPVGEILLDSKGNIIEVPTKETLLNVLKMRLTEEEGIIIMVRAKDLSEITKVIKDIHAL